MPAKGNKPQFCFIVSTKVSKKAVERNFIRRRLKEAFRLELKNLEIPILAVIIGQSNVATCNFEDLKKEVARCLSSVSKKI